MNKATDSKIQMAIAEKREEVQMAIMSELTANHGDKSKVTISKVEEEVKNNYSSQAEKNAIIGEAIGEEEDKFPGTITYNKPASGIPKAIIVTVDENLGVTAELEEPDAYSDLEKITPTSSDYVSIGGTYYNSPDLTGFNPESTYYVTYDENGDNETIAGRIDRVSQNGNLVGDGTNNIWYDYGNYDGGTSSKKIWANVVTVTGNDVTYWVWIPRYVYKENTSTKTTDVKFVDKNNVCYRDINGTKTQVNVSDYTLADSFRFDTTNLYGYWVSKYEVQDTVTAGLEKQYTKNVNGKMVVNTTNPKTVDSKYTVYVNGVLYENETTMPCIIKGLKVGKKYDVCVYNLTDKIMVGRSTSSLNNIQVDLTGFNKDCTYYVLYDDNGNEVSSEIKIDYDANGNPTNIPDGSVGTWYDYDRKIWANVVTKNGDEIAYWTYIPRYEYIEGVATKTTSIKFIPVTQTKADDGWAIPESFTFGTTQLKGYWLSKYEVQ